MIILHLDSAAQAKREDPKCFGHAECGQWFRTASELVWHLSECTGDHDDIR